MTSVSQRRQLLLLDLPAEILVKVRGAVAYLHRCPLLP